jgi:hypothetical protein
MSTVTVEQLITTLKSFPQTMIVDVDNININMNGVITIQSTQADSIPINEDDIDSETMAENVAAIRSDIVERVLAELDDAAWGAEETPDINAVLDFLVSFVYGEDVFEFIRDLLIHGYDSIVTTINDLDEEDLFDLYDYMNDE